MKWQDDFSIGVSFVDADHKVLVQLITEVSENVGDSEEYANMGSVLSALADYCDYHFKREEELLKGVSYPSLISHQALHDNLTNEVQQLAARYMRDPKSVKSDELLSFLENWLRDHILTHDKAYAPHVQNAGAAEKKAEAVNTMQAKPFSWADLQVLVVDDNNNFRHLIETILRSVGVQKLESVDCAEEGLKRLAAHPFDIVISDWYMDAMDGLEFTRRIRGGDKATADSKIIMLSGQENPDLEAQAKEVGVNQFLRKPVSARDLLLTIAGLTAA